MHPAGVSAFERRTEENSLLYSHERSRDPALPPEQEHRFQAEATAWKWFQSRPPGYRRTALHWVTAAKRPETREKRLTQLIEASAQERRLGWPDPGVVPRKHAEVDLRAGPLSTLRSCS